MVPPRSGRVSRAPPYSRAERFPPVRGCHPLWPGFPAGSGSCLSAAGLVRVRSPLLTESRLMSFPPGTEMFQFPGFAPPAYGFSRRYPLSGVGCPIRRPPDRSPLAAPRGFSQRAASFVASWRQGIHQVPLLPSTPAGGNRARPRPPWGEAGAGRRRPAGATVPTKSSAPRRPARAARPAPARSLARSPAPTAGAGADPPAPARAPSLSPRHHLTMSKQRRARAPRGARRGPPGGPGPTRTADLTLIRRAL